MDYEKEPLVESVAVGEPVEATLIEGPESVNLGQQPMYSPPPLYHQ